MLKTLKKRFLYSVMLLLILGAGVCGIKYCFFDSRVEKTENKEIKERKIEKNEEKEEEKQQSWNYLIKINEMGKERKDRSMYIDIPQIVFVSDGFISSDMANDMYKLEDKINETIYKAATDWMTYDFLGMKIEQLNPEITCHNDKYLSITLHYWLRVQPGGKSISNHIVIDMQTGKRIFLNDIIDDEEKFVSDIKNGKNVNARRSFIWDQDDANVLLQETLAEITEDEFHDIVKYCSMEEKEFPLIYEDGQKLPTIWHKPGFYIEGNCIVINPYPYSELSINGII